MSHDSTEDMKESLKFVQNLKRLEKQLRRVAYVQSLADADHSESEAIAYGVLEIQRAAKELDRAVNDLLRNDDNDDLVRDLLTDIGDAYREIESHMKEMRYFSYLFT